MPAPLLAAGIWVWIVATIPPLIIKILVALGIGFITYSGVDLALDAAKIFIQDQMAGLPAYMLALMGLLKMDTAISMLLAAYSARFAAVAASGVLTKMTLGAAGNSVGA